MVRHSINLRSSNYIAIISGEKLLARPYDEEKLESMNRVYSMRNSELAEQAAFVVARVSDYRP